MTDFVALTCPTCGGSIKIFDYKKLNTCEHCNNEIAVKSGSQLDKTISQFAITQISLELDRLNQQRLEHLNQCTAIDRKYRNAKQHEIFLTLTRISIVVLGILLGVYTFLYLLKIDEFLNLMSFASVYRLLQLVFEYMDLDWFVVLERMLASFMIFVFVVSCVFALMVGKTPEQHSNEIEAARNQTNESLKNLATVMREKEITLKQCELTLTGMKN